MTARLLAWDPGAQWTGIANGTLRGNTLLVKFGQEATPGGMLPPSTYPLLESTYNVVIVERYVIGAPYAPVEPAYLIGVLRHYYRDKKGAERYVESGAVDRLMVNRVWPDLAKTLVGHGGDAARHLIAWAYHNYKLDNYGVVVQRADHPNPSPRYILR